MTAWGLIRKVGGVWQHTSNPTYDKLKLYKQMLDAQPESYLLEGSTLDDIGTQLVMLNSGWPTSVVEVNAALIQTLRNHLESMGEDVYNLDRKTLDATPGGGHDKKYKRLFLFGPEATRKVIDMMRKWHDTPTEER